MPKDWAPLVYCWRGGKRSGTLTWLLREIGFDARQLAGGYKAFRARVNAELPQLAQRFRYVTICGCTGTGKTALLAALADAGAQVIDLEGWPIIAAPCWARVTRRSRRKSALTLLWNACARWTRRGRCSLNRKARRSVWCKCPTRCASR
jgi:hypothetical protein